MTEQEITEVISWVRRRYIFSHSHRIRQKRPLLVIGNTASLKHWFHFSDPKTLQTSGFKKLRAKTLSLQTHNLTNHSVMSHRLHLLNTGYDKHFIQFQTCMFLQFP